MQDVRRDAGHGAPNGKQPGPGASRQAVEQTRAVAAVKREVNAALGRFTLRSGATPPLKDVYRDEAQQYDICDVEGKLCF